MNGLLAIFHVDGTASGLHLNLTTVTTGVVVGLLSLSRGLDGNLLTELPVGVFDGPESLQVL